MPAVLDTNISLKPGQTALVQPGAIEVTFVEVSGDSRCAKGEQCVWEGDATIRIRLGSATTSIVEQTLHTAAREVRSAGYAGHTVRLVALYPQPVSGQSLAPAEYTAVLLVTRGDPDNYR